MIKSKTVAIIFAICFIFFMSGQILRVAQYGLYGSEQYWSQTVSIPEDINSPSQTALRNLINKGESEGIITCFPEQKICHYTGKGYLAYGAFSAWEQSSDYYGWLVLIIKCAIQSLIPTVLLSVAYSIIKKHNLS
jgi:hypothetical protein